MVVQTLVGIVCCAAFADDAAGVFRVHIGTNGVAAVAMPFVPIGTNGVKAFLSGPFAGDGGPDSDRLFHVSAGGGPLSSSVFSSGSWVDPGDGTPSAPLAEPGDALVVSSGDGNPFDFFVHGLVPTSDTLETPLAPGGNLVSCGFPSLSFPTGGLPQGATAPVSIDGGSLDGEFLPWKHAFVVTNETGASVAWSRPRPYPAPFFGWPMLSGLSVDPSGAFSELAVETGGRPTDILLLDSESGYYSGLGWTHALRVAGYPESFSWRDTGVADAGADCLSRFYLVSDASRDADGDGIPDTLESRICGTSPLLADTDGDGVDDGLELAWGTDPLIADQPLPFLFFEPFERPSVVPGALSGQNGWLADGGDAAIVQEDTFRSGRAALRIESTDSASEAASRVVECHSEVVWADAYQKFAPGAEAISTIGNAFAAYGFDGEGHPVFTDGDAVATNTAVAVEFPSRWVRCTCRFDFPGRKWDFYLDGMAVALGLGMRGGAESLHELAFRGSGHFDDLTLSSERPKGLSSDGDALPDEWEFLHFGTLDRDGTGDADGDGMSDLAECRAGTDPLAPSWDTDGDGLPDWWEVANGLDPLSAGSDGEPIFSETFELPDVSLGDADGQHGWHADRPGTVVVQGGKVHSGEGAARLDGGTDGNGLASISHMVSTDELSFWSDVWQAAISGVDGLAMAGDAFAAYAFDDAGHPVMTDGDALSTNLQVSVGDDGRWIRCTCHFDFAARRWDLYVDGMMAGRDLAMRGTARSLSEISFAGEQAFFDSLKLTRERPPGLSSDGDEIPDEWELENFGSLGRDGSEDLDGDGLSDLGEFLAGTDPAVSDTDGDGIPDGWEAANGLDPLDPSDAADDPDGDGCPNSDEYLFGGDPHLAEPDPRQRRPGLRAAFWRTAGRQATLPDFATLLPSTVGSLPCVDMPANAWRDGTALGNCFACRLEGFVRVPADGRYTFRLSSCAGASMSLDGETVLSDLLAHNARTQSGTLDLARGFHAVRIDFYKNTGSESLVLEWEGPGLARETVPAEAFCHLPADDVPPAGYGFGLASGDAVTSGAIHAPLAGTYRLTAATVGGFRLWLDDALLMDRSSAWGAASHSASLPLAAGIHDIRLERFGGHAEVALSWSKDGTPSEPVPERFLLHPVSPEAVDGDGDGMPDWWEGAHSLDATDPSDAAPDPDGDGLSNLDEFRAGTDPHSPDTDGDGMPDAWEAAHGTCPFLNDALADPDGDGLVNIEEYSAGTDVSNADTDGDGVSDGDERNVFLGDPLAADFDGTFTTNAVLAASDADSCWGSWIIDGESVVLADRCGTVFYTNDLVLADAGLRQIRLRTAFSGPYDAELVCMVDGVRVGVATIPSSVSVATNEIAFLTRWMQPGAHIFAFELQNFANNVQFSLSNVIIGVPGGPDADGNGICDWMDARMRGSRTDRGNAIQSTVSPFCMRGRSAALPHVEMPSGELAVRPLPFRGWWANVPLNAADGADVAVTYEDGMKVENVHIDWIPFDFMSETNVVLRRGDSLLLAPDPGESVSLDGLPLAPDGGSAGIPCRFDLCGEHFLEGRNGFATNIVRVVVAECASLESVPAWRGKVNTLRLSGTNFAEMAVSWDQGCEVVSAADMGGSCICQLSVPAYGHPRSIAFEIPNADASVAGGMALEPFAAYYTIEGRYYVVERLADGTRVVENRLSAFDVPPSLTLKMTGNSGICFEDGSGCLSLTGGDFDDLGDCIYRFMLPEGVTNPCQFLRAYFNGTEVAQ